MPNAENTRHARVRAIGLNRLAGQAPGLVTSDGVPARRRVILVDMADLVIHAISVSAPDGTFEFDYLDGSPGRWMLIARDSYGVHNAVVADHVTAVPMLIPE